MRQFIKEVYGTFLPSQWKVISSRSVWQGLCFFSKMLLIAFVLMLLLAVPRLAGLPGRISSQLNKFEVLRLEGNVTMSSPIRLPEPEPVAVLDTSGAYTSLSDERLVITRDKIFYRPFFSTKEIAVSDLKDLKNNREQVKAFLAVLAFFVLPSVLFYSYVLVWLKYFVLMAALSLVLFVLLDLTHWRRTWKQLFVVCAHVSTLPVVSEVVAKAINPKILIPVLSVYGILKVYLIPVVILAVLAFGAALCARYQGREDEAD